jgi:peptidoglycan/LPS O-acetylase OafA/YrhL
MGSALLQHRHPVSRTKILDAKQRVNPMNFFDRVPTLDGWRGLAILGVVLYHARSSFVEGPLPRLAVRGAFGVDLFFAISGFLICGKLFQELQNTGTFSLKTFYSRRLFRIVPALAFYLIVLAALAGFGWSSTHPWEFFSSALFVRNYFPLFHGGTVYGAFTAQFWSLAVEEHFYLIWPLVMMVCAKSTRRSVTITIAVAGAVLAWRLVDLKYGWLVPFGTDINSKTDTRFDALLWGCLAAYVYPATKRAFDSSIALDRVLRYAWVAIAPLALAAMYFDRAPGSILARSLIFPALIVSTAISPFSLLSRLLEWPVLRWIGRLSYSFYIWQQLFLFPTNLPESPLNALQHAPYNIICILLAGVLSYYCVERPMIDLGRQWFHRRGIVRRIRHEILPLPDIYGLTNWQPERTHD